MRDLPKVRLLVRLFVSFLQTSPVSFGGGYAMLPLIEREIVVKRRWLSSAEMGNVFAVAGAAPGGIGVSAAALVGFRLAGVMGAAFAVIGMTLPTFAIMLALIGLYNGFSAYPPVRGAFMGIQVGVIALIMFAALRMGKSAFVDWATVIAGAGAVAILLFTAIHPIWLIPAGAAIGMLLFPMMQKQRNECPWDKMQDFYYGDGI